MGDATGLLLGSGIMTDNGYVYAGYIIPLSLH